MKCLIVPGEGTSETGQKLLIFKSKTKYNFFHVDYNFQRPYKPPKDYIVVTVERESLDHHHMIGNFRNNDRVIERLKSGIYFQPTETL